MKHTLIKIFILAVLAVFKSSRFYSQSAQLCISNSQNVCTSPTFTFNSNINQGLTAGLNVSNPSTNPQNGNGASPVAPPNTGCLLSNGPGPQWLIITANTTGNLGFSFGGAGSQYPQAGFYDWAMWPYNPSTCANIFSNTLPPVACVWNCTSIGGTGMGPPPPAVPGTTPSPCNYAPSIPVVAGQQFLILLSNFSGVTTSVSIVNNGTAGLSCNPLMISSAYACPNQPAVVTATWSGINNVTYTLYPGGSIQTNPSFTVAAPATQVYTVLAQGQDSVSATINSSTTFVLNVAPNTPITVSNPTVCQNGTVSLTASLPTATAYGWSGPGFSSALQNPVLNNVQPGAAGIYVVSANLNFPTVNPKVACPQTATAQLTVLQTSSVTTIPSFTQCEGTTVNLMSSAAGATGFSWIGPAYSSSLQNPVLSSVLPSATGVYTVTAAFTLGAFSCIRTGTSSVSIVPTPTVSVLLPNNICQYGSANLAANGPGALAYQWTGPAGFTATTQVVSIPNIQPSQSGLYNATAIYGIGTQTCSMSNSGQINVALVSNIVITPTAISVCKPHNATFQASAIGATSYSWAGPNSFTAATAQTTVYYPDLVASGLYTVTSTVMSGTLTCHNTNTASLTVNPVFNFTLEPFKQICYNDNLTVTGPVGATSYTWFGGNGGVTSNAKDLVIPSIQPNQSGIYTLSVSLGPCNSSSNVQINVLTPIAYTYTPDDQVICRGDTVILEAGASGGSQNYAYNWIPSTYLSAPTGSFLIGQPLGTTVYNVIGYDIACPNYTIGRAFTITVKQPPIPNLKLDKTEGCEPLCLFYSSGVDTSDRSIITYDFGGIRQMQKDNFSYCLPDPGSYTLTIETKGRNGCIGSYTFPEVLVVYPKPHSDISWSPLVPNTTDNQVTFNPSFRYGPVISYNWSFGGTGIAGYDTTDQKNPQRIYENVGKYPVMLISKNEMCSDTVVKILDIRDDFNVFIPNTFTPNGDGNNDVFMIKGLGMRTEGYSMDIYDRWANLLYSTREILKGWDGTVKGQLAPDGVYVYRIRVVSANGDGRKEYTGHVTLLK